MSATPLISVIVPVYNAAPYLRECLDSIVAQTVGDIEVICVDDGSTDSSGAICREYAERYPEYFRYIYKENEGQAVARNTGLDAATGSYIAFCDADDTYAPAAMEILLGQMSGCDIACAGFVQRMDKPASWPSKAIFESVSAEKAIGHLLYQKPGFSPTMCAKLYRRELFEHERFTPGLYYEDLEITPRLYAQCHKIAVSDCTLYFYRQNPTSFISTWHPRRTDTLRATGMIHGFIASRYPALLPAARSRRFSAYFNIFVEAVRHNDPALADHCFDMIRHERLAILTDPEVRLKNRLGALISYTGRRISGLVARL